MTTLALLLVIDYTDDFVLDLSRGAFLILVCFASEKLNIVGTDPGFKYTLVPPIAL